MNSLANKLLERIANGEKITLRDMCIALGWQGDYPSSSQRIKFRHYHFTGRAK